MKIIQTFWTAGQDPLKHGFGWAHPEYNLMSWALSCLSLREHYDEVELYTDSAGYHILIEVLQLPYSKTHVIFDDFQCLPHHWALSKIKTYSLQTEPFLHIDGDIYLPRPLPEKVLNAPLVAQNREIGTIYYRRMMDEGVLNHPDMVFPTYLEKGLKEKSIASYNMGVFGGNDIDSIKKYCNEVFHFLETNKMNDTSVAHSHVGCNVLFEQILFATWAEHNNHKVKNVIEHGINDNGYTFNDFCNLQLFKQKIIFHILGGHKKNLRILTMLEQTLLSIAPKHYLHIIKLFPELNCRFSNKPKYDFIYSYPKTYEKELHEVKDMLEDASHYEILSWEKKLAKSNMNLSIRNTIDKVKVKCIPWLKIVSLHQSLEPDTERLIRLRLGINKEFPLKHIVFIPSLRREGYKEIAINNISFKFLSLLLTNERSLTELYEFALMTYNIKNDLDKRTVKTITYNETYNLRKLGLLTFY